jgi:hypothetical protein
VLLDRAGEESVELEHGVDRDGLPRRDLEHPGLDLVEGVGGDPAEGEADADGL